MADTKDLKSFGAKSRVGSSPTTPNNSWWKHTTTAGKGNKKTMIEGLRRIYNDTIKFQPKLMYATIALRSTHPKFKHAAIVFHNGEIIAWANNKGSHHAEVRALEAARLYGYRHDLVLLSLRVYKNGKLALAKPCMSCLIHIKLTTYGTKILYSTNKQTIVQWGKEKKRNVK